MKTEKLDLSKINVVNLLDDSIPDNTAEVQEEKEDTQDNEEVNTDETTDEKAQEESLEVDDSTTEQEDPQELSNENEDSSTDDEQPSIIDELKQKLGYEVEGDFDDNVDGLMEFTKGTADQMAQDQIETFFERFPDVREYMNYRADGGDPKKYFGSMDTELDYSTIEINSDDISTQKQLVSKTLEAQGFTPEEIKETLEDYEDAEILEKHANKSLQRLKRKQETDKSKLVESQREFAEKQEKENEQRWQEISTIIDTGTLNGLNVPQREKKKFFDWLAVPVDKQGNSQRTLEREKISQETMLSLEYIMYKGFDLNKLAENTLKTKKAQSLRKRLGGATTASSRLKGGKTQKAGISLPTLDEVF